MQLDLMNMHLYGSDLDETRNLSLLEHSAEREVFLFSISARLRAEISVKGAKMDKNARVARIFAPITMKLSRHDVKVVIHK